MPAKPKQQKTRTTAPVTLPVAGEVPADAGPSQVRYNYPPSHRFTFLARRDSYDVFMTAKGPEVLPVLHRFEHIPGVNGVRSVRGVLADGDAAPALGIAQSRGWILVPKTWDVIAFGQPSRSYEHLYKGTHGPIWLDCWTRLYQLGGGAQTAQDREGYFDFLRRVHADLLGNEIDANVLAGLRARLYSDLTSAKVLAKNSPGSAWNVGLLDAKMAAFDSAPATSD